jgi:hypothetical protein
VQNENFQKTIQDISDKIEKQSQDSVAVIKENETLRDNLLKFKNQYDLREEQFKHELKTKALELQLAEAKFQKQEEIAKAETLKVILIQIHSLLLLFTFLSQKYALTLLLMCLSE